jgi:hypothetical protein
VEFNGSTIGRVGSKEDQKTYTYLGLLIEEKLDWHAHAEKVATSLNSGIYALSRLQGCSTMEIRKQVYNALIKSHLEFMIPIWGACRKGDLQRLVRKQKKAVRLVHGYTNQMEHTSILFKKSGILKFQDLYHVNAMKFVWQTQHLVCPGSEHFAKKSGEFTTREAAKELLALPDFIPTQQECMPSICLSRMWNNASDDLKNSPTVKYLVNQLSKNFMSVY